mmetsp:Transcript_4573/g.28991  ORF Transcript_4573/g.28991 Transcript_4573/m.28991 type:complete len:90 (+) Transcript_4573:199-468(+)
MCRMFASGQLQRTSPMPSDSGSWQPSTRKLLRPGRRCLTRRENKAAGCPQLQVLIKIRPGYQLLICHSNDAPSFLMVEPHLLPVYEAFP